MAQPQIIGRYALMAEIAAGGMATVHVGCAAGAGGFSRTVAIKRLHPELASDPTFAAMLVGEARLAARIAHPNVVRILDVVDSDGELSLVMDYIEGETLGRLIRATRARGERIPPAIVATILVGVLRGLDAAHEAKDADGRLLGIIHRDVSPQNVMVGVDGIARVLDFGIAKATTRAANTPAGRVKGKLAYMAPEQLRRATAISRQADVYAAGVVLWEALTGVRLFTGQNDGEILEKVLSHRIDAPSARVTDLPPTFDAVVLRALAAEPSARFPTAREMASAIEAAWPPAASSTVGAWVAEIAAEPLATRAALIAASHREIGAADHLAPQAASPRPPTKHVPARSRRVLAIAALAALALTTTGMLVARRGHDARSAVVPPASSSSLPAADPLASTLSDPTHATPLAPPPPAKTTPAPTRIPRPARAVRAHCDPPYTIDDAGSRRFKPECF